MGNVGFQNNFSPSFGAMKKSQFKGLDLLCVNKFQAPIEKYNSNEDLQNWAKNKLVTDVFSKDLTGRTNRTTIERTSALKTWKNFFENNKMLTAAASLLVGTALFSKLSPKTDDVPPPLDEKVLMETLDEVKDKKDVNIQKAYTDKLKSNLTGQNGKIEGWIVIPSYDRDPENFEKNIKKLEVLSSNSWCTKFSKAEQHLMQGDFHIFYENGEPKIGVQMGYPKEINEVQGAENNDMIPLKYINEVEKYMKDNGYTLSGRAEQGFNIAKYTAETIERAKKDLAGDIDSKNYKNILKYFNIQMTENPDKTVTLSKYNDYYGYKNMGIDVQDMLKNVTRIEGDGDFRNCPATDLSKLEHIGGYADFTDAKVNNLSNLKTIGKFGIFKNSNVENLNSLESCQKVDISYSNIKEVPNLKEGNIIKN